MSDFSSLQLSVDSKKAVAGLKNLEGNLNKTNAAANNLKSTLKSIGMGIGLTAIIKQSLQLSNITNALDKRFSSFFSGKTSRDISILSDKLAITNRNAKELLVTAGKFGSATGFNGAGLANFSEQLTTLAADVAAFHGIDDINMVLEKFGAATLGRTRGLQEFGVAIDTTSDAFKRQVKEVQEANNITEAQAKQLVILQEAQAQLGMTVGSAAEQSFSAWQQFQNLMSNLKDVMAEVGTAIGVVFGPLISILNSILNIPFAKQLIGWGSALLILGLIFNKLGKTITSLNETMQGSNKLVTEQTKLSAEQTKLVSEQNKLVAEQNKYLNAQSLNQIVQLQAKYNELMAQRNKLLLQQVSLEKQINSKQDALYRVDNNDLNDFQKRLLNDKPKLVDQIKLSLDKNIEAKFKVDTNLSQINPQIKTIENQVKGLGTELLVAADGMGLLTGEFKNFANTNNLLAVSVNALSATEVIAKNTTNALNTTTKSSIILEKLKNGLLAIRNAISKAYNYLIAQESMIKSKDLIKEGAKTGLQLKDVLLAPLKSLINFLKKAWTKIKSSILPFLGKLLVLAGLFIALADGFNIISQAFTKGFDKVDLEQTITGKIGKWFDQKLYDYSGGKFGTDYAGIAENAKKAAEATRDFKQAMSEYLQLESDLNKKKKDRQLKKLEKDNPRLALSKVDKEIGILKKEQAHLEATLKTRRSNDYDKSDSIAYVKEQKELFKKMNANYDEIVKYEDKRIELQNKILQANFHYFQTQSDIVLRLRHFSDQLNWTRLAQTIPGVGKKGEFGNFVDLSKLNNLDDDIEEIHKRIKKIRSKAIYERRKR